MENSKWKVLRMEMEKKVEYNRYLILRLLGNYTKGYIFRDGWCTFSIIDFA